MVVIQDPKTGKLGHWITKKQGGKYQHIFIFLDKRRKERAHESRSKNPYVGFTREELRQSILDFQSAVNSEKREIRGVEKIARSFDKQTPRIISDVRARGGICAPRKNQAYYTEYSQSVPSSVKRAIGRKNGRPLDEMADELGMSARKLIDALATANPDTGAELRKYYKTDDTSVRELQRELDQMIDAYRRAA